MAGSRASVGIISIGDMGLGIAKLLQAHNYHVLTTCVGRRLASLSPTQRRVESASIELLPDRVQLVNRSDYLLSIVPPGQAVATAEAIIAAYQQHTRPASSNPLYYLDLNAIAPSTARHISAAFATKAPTIRFIDGGIIGGPPLLAPSTSPTDPVTWKRPSIPLSGPHELASAQPSGAHLAATLRTKHLSPDVGTASGLKACFASLTKGYTALAIQSFSTASQLGVLEHLLREMDAANPLGRQQAERGLVGMPNKAYRWVAEMDEIGKTFDEDGGWGGENVYKQVAGVYRVVADDTELGSREGKMEVQEAVDGLVRGLKARKEKTD
ncbi:6-phosphogluconate dehydrogenase [Phyllosticta citrichinensis]